MKLFLESAALDEIRWGLDARFVDGVYVTPAVLDADAFGVDALTQVESIARVAPVPLLVVVGAIAAEDIYRGGRDLVKVADNVVAVVPFVEDGITALRRLATEGVRTAATFIVTAAQALLAAKAGAAHVCVSVEELEAHGHDPAIALRETRTLFDRHGIECELLAVSAPSSRAVTSAFLAGADAVATPARVLRALPQHPLTDRSLDHMLGELSRRPRGGAR